VYDIVRNAEVRDVPIHHQRLAGTGFEVMHFISVDDQFSDRSLGVGTINGNAKAVGTMAGTVAALKSLLNMMDVIFQQLDMGTGPHNTNAQWSQPMLSCPEITNFKTLDPYIASVMNRQYGTSARGDEMLRVEH